MNNQKVIESVWSWVFDIPTWPVIATSFSVEHPTP